MIDPIFGQLWLGQKYRALHAGVHFLVANFGSADQEDFYREFGADGPPIMEGLVSQGWARYRPKHGDVAVTEAGQACDRATSFVEARL